MKTTIPSNKSNLQLNIFEENILSLCNLQSLEWIWKMKSNFYALQLNFVTLD